MEGSSSGNENSIEKRQKILSAFVGNTDTKARRVTADLDEIIRDVAEIGASRYPWEHLKALLIQKLEEVIDAYRVKDSKTLEVDGEAFDTRYKRVLEFMTAFQSPPFTLQRMCELLHEPKRYYTNTEKFFLAFSKLVCGISYPAEDLEAIMRKESKTSDADPSKDDGMEVQMDSEPSVKKAGDKKEPGSADIVQSSMEAE
uniref:Serine/threonine-protein phosphatase 4 regulatory subunit 2 n=2 Tax=Lotharella globosa TaxID=91324 RepID=A0A7S4DFW5_9EUKA|mmetsp:Transcript_38503/g.73990  ORF Transcript_38503/g.73990 Transcript_38503/m.73990 type:complete len:200 (+) Transcript_38503:37-636(+)